MRDGRFEWNDGNENFMRLVATRDSREFVNGIVHSHRGLRDDGTAL